MRIHVSDYRNTIISTDRLGEKFKDLTGKIIKNFDVLSYEGYRIRGVAEKVPVFKCRCRSCNKIIYLDRYAICRANGDCGCNLSNHVAPRYKQPEYPIYISAMCDARRANYEICNEWKNENNGYANFYKWLHDNNWKPNLSGLRIVNRSLKVISPSNLKVVTCPFSFTYKHNGYIVINHYCYSVKDWGKIVGITHSTILARVESGWELKESVLTPLIVRTRKKFEGHHVHDLIDLNSVITPEWEAKNMYQFFKDKGLIKEK